MDEQAPLVTRGLTKSYRVGHIRQSLRPALVDLDLEVRPGEVLGYVGPNGSGKTTTLKLLIGLLKPDAGDIRFFGLPHLSRPWRYRVGYLPEQPYFYDYLTPAEYLDYAGRLFGMSADKRRSRGAELLELVGLQDSRGLPMRRFSKGMLQRVGVAQALVNDPDLLILDEPMSGLDPLGRRLVRNLILELRRAGKTILFSTHILSDAESLCDRVALLRLGRLIRVGALGEMLGGDVEQMEILVREPEVGLPEIDGAVRRESLGDRVRLEASERDLAAVVTAVSSAGGRVLSVQPVRQSLEEYFFEEMSGGGEGGHP